LKTKEKKTKNKKNIINGRNSASNLILFFSNLDDIKKLKQAIKNKNKKLVKKLAK
tara:strand:+ start:179 stop:343 length:165 start_codon:yes stop_codon:yes gene_type:complete